MEKKTSKTASKSVSAMSVLLKKTGQSTKRISAISKQFDSVMSLAKADVEQLMTQNPDMHISEARDIQQRARAMSVVIARQFREQRLTASVRDAGHRSTGIKGLVDGPTYTDMFNPDWANHCPPDAIEATTSPVAYLADLYRYARDLEATGDPAEVITLDARRPDLQNLVLDHSALNRIEPTIVLVNEILETSIRTYLDGVSPEDKTVDDAMLEARYPNVLPFERYTSQINYVLGRKDFSLGDVLRLVDADYPYFKEPGVHSLLSDAALIQDTGFGPAQQMLLLESPYFTPAGQKNSGLIAGKWRVTPGSRLLQEVTDDEAQSTTFFQDNFGIGTEAELLDTQVFCLRTGLTTEELEALLSVGAFAPSLSANAQAPAGEVDSSLSGSVYINAAKAPAMGIHTEPARMGGDDGSQVLEGPRHLITNSTADRMDRMNRMIRLQRWMDLPFDQVDLIIVASMRAEQQGENFPVITENTLRAIGLFQSLRHKHNVTAEDFAALIQGINVYGRGNTPSHFDRVFNSQALFAGPLMLDGTPMTVTPVTDPDRERVAHLCTALGMTYESFRYVAGLVGQAFGDTPLVWSVDVISAFYRLVRLPRYLGLSTIEAVALLEILDHGASTLVSNLAGITRVKTFYLTANSDILTVIHAWVDCVSWMQEHGWQVRQLFTLLAPGPGASVATETQRNMLEQLNQRLEAALITDSSFVQIGAPQVSSVDSDDNQVADAIDWFVLLKSFIDTGETSQMLGRGLVLHLEKDNESRFEEHLYNNTEQILTNLGIEDDALPAKITNMVMRARAAQHALLMEGLAEFLEVSADQADALLGWSEGSRYEVLSEVRRVFGASNDNEIPIGDNILLLLTRLSIRAEVTRHLDLSPALIREFLAHPQWFGVPDTEMSFPAVYFLSQYVLLLQSSEQDEAAMLDYLRLVNTYTGESDGDRRLIRESAALKLAVLLKWGVREILAVARRVDVDNATIRQMPELDLAHRLANAGRQLGLDARALLALGDLMPTDQTAVYREAAEWALNSLNEAASGVADPEVGQSRAYSMTVSSDHLVANMPGSTVEFKLTLLDLFDVPLADVWVTWQTSLGQLSSVQTVTDSNGIATVSLSSGAVMGDVSVKAQFGLGEVLEAPHVTIGCDLDSLRFVDGSSDPMPPEVLANRLESIFFQVEQVDNYGNKGSDLPVSWFTSLGEFQRHVTMTDYDGVARAELRSLHPGDNVSVVAVAENSSRFEFSGIEFANKPYILYVRVLGVLNVGYDAEVECRVINIDGTPRPQVAVQWSCTSLGAITPTSITNDDGVAISVFTSTASGQVTITAASEEAVSNSAENIEIFPRSEVFLVASGNTYVVGSPAIEFACTIMSGSNPAPNRLIRWTIDGGQAIEVYTNGLGVAIFSSKFDARAEEYRVRVELVGTDEFGLVSVQAVGYRFSTSIEGYLRPEAPGLLSRYETYSWVVKVYEVDKVDPVEGVAFTLTAPMADALGVVVEGLGQRHYSSVDGSRFSISFSPLALKGNLLLKLAGDTAVEWEENFKIGYYLKLQDVTSIGDAFSMWLGPINVSADFYIPGILQGDRLSLHIKVPTAGWERSCNFYDSATSGSLLGTVNRELQYVVGRSLTVDGGLYLEGCVFVQEASSWIPEPT